MKKYVVPWSIYEGIHGRPLIEQFADWVLIFVGLCESLSAYTSPVVWIRRWRM